METSPTNVIGSLVQDQQGLEPGSVHRPRKSGKVQPSSQMGSSTSPSGKVVWDISSQEEMASVETKIETKIKSACKNSAVRLYGKMGKKKKDSKTYEKCDLNKNYIKLIK